MDIHLAGSRPTRKAPSESFTGTVWQDPIITPQLPMHLVAGRVAFEPSARTAWLRFSGIGKDKCEIILMSRLIFSLTSGVAFSITSILKLVFFVNSKISCFVISLSPNYLFLLIFG